MICTQVLAEDGEVMIAGVMYGGQLFPHELPGFTTLTPSFFNAIHKILSKVAIICYYL